MASLRVSLLLAILVTGCAAESPSENPLPDGGSDGKADGSGSDSGLCSPACAPEPNAEVTCTAFATCESTCSDGFARCGGTCVTESTQQCGDSCTPCSAPSHGSATCESGVCGVACDPGYVQCEGYSGPTCCPYGSEVVAPSELGGYMSQVAVDDAGSVHVAYYNAAEHHLMYAAMTSSAVTRERLPRYWSSGGGAKMKLALGSRGPSIVYTYPNGSSGLFVDDRRTSGWSHYKLVDGSTPGGFGVAGDRAGRLHVCYTDWGGGIHYAIRRGDQWTVSDVAADPDAKGACAVAADPDGLPHIVYYRQSAGDLVYAKGAADGTFATNVIDSNGNVGSEVAIAIDSDGTPHIAAHKSDTWGLRYATLVAGGGFMVRDVGSGKIGQSPAIAVTSSGEVVITFWDSTRYRIGIVLRDTAGAWQQGSFEELWRGSASLASAPDGSIWMATGTGDVAVQNLIGDSWPTYAIDVEHKTGDDVTLLSRGGTPTLVYSTSGNDGTSYVEIATHQGADWSRTQLATEGTDSSAALDAAGNVHVAYQTATSISYATEATGLAIEEVAASASEPSLALSATGTPYVAYVSRSGTTYSLVLATRTASGWSPTTIGAAAAYGTYRRPVVRVSGSTVHLLWHDGVAKTIVYASSGDGYTKVTVQTSASLAHDLYVGADGVPHACVFQTGSSSWPDLRYAKRSGAAWSTMYVAPPGTAKNSGGCAIAADAAGTIGIARSLVYGAGLGELVLTTLGATTTHTVLQDDFYSAGLSITAGTAGLEVVGTGRPYDGSGHDQNRVRWAHR
jgi:hypothetical protein